MFHMKHAVENLPKQNSNIDIMHAKSANGK